jgi:glycosyltransferase involved in cell wall biosynthesis
MRYSNTILDSKKIHYVLFSNFEKPLYSKSFNMDEKRIFYVPYGDLSEKGIPEAGMSTASEIKNEGPFYFSGGGSNRDYLALIETFKSLSLKLVIACSKFNHEVNEKIIPSNIKVLRDIPSEIFDAYVRLSKACIIPIKYDTGAAGQSCLLRYMKYGKIIIATETGIIREYIEDGISGVLVKNNHEALGKAVCEVDAQLERYQCCADAAYRRFMNIFSGAAIAQRLDDLINRK